MHFAGPLERDNSPFQTRQKIQRQGKACDAKDREQDKRIGTPDREGNMQERDHHMTHDQDRQISGPVIGARGRQVFATFRARVTQLEVAIEKRALAAARARALVTAPQGRPKRAWRIWGLGDLGRVR